jgi:hypothetical protein
LANTTTCGDGNLWRSSRLLITMTSVRWQFVVPYHTSSWPQQSAPNNKLTKHSPFDD